MKVFLLLKFYQEDDGSLVLFFGKIQWILQPLQNDAVYAGFRHIYDTERAYFSEIISGYNSELTQKLNRLLAVFLLIHHITDPDHSETETQLPCDSDYTSNVLSERS